MLRLHILLDRFGILGQGFGVETNFNWIISRLSMKFLSSVCVLSYVLANFVMKVWFWTMTYKIDQDNHIWRLLEDIVSPAPLRGCSQMTSAFSHSLISPMSYFVCFTNPSAVLIFGGTPLSYSLCFPEPNSPLAANVIYRQQFKVPNDNLTSPNLWEATKYKRTRKVVSILVAMFQVSLSETGWQRSMTDHAMMPKKRGSKATDLFYIHFRFWYACRIWMNIKSINGNFNQQTRFAGFFFCSTKPYFHTYFQ